MPIRPLRGDPPISCDSKCHVARGSAPGSDYGVSEGTIVIAPFDGTVTIGYNSLAGDYTSVLSNTGIRVYLMHLKVRMITSGFVSQGTEIAETGGALGASYSGDSTGPHLHADIRDSGVQWGMEEWLAAKFPINVTIPTGVDTSVLITDNEDEMNIVKISNIESPGIFGAFTGFSGVVKLATGSVGDAQLRTINKINASIAANKAGTDTSLTANVTGEEFDAFTTLI